MSHSRSLDLLSSFPVECRGDVQLAWKQVDGRRASIVHAGDVSSIRHFARDINALDARMRFEEAANGLKLLLNEYLPNLEQLRIKTILNDTDDFIRIKRPATYTLCIANLPRLHTLVAYNTQINLGWPSYGNLRRLHLQFGVEGDALASFRLPLDQFLHIVQNCPQLESLYVDRYIAAPMRAGALPPPALSLAGHTHLQELSFRDDSPHILSRILSCLIISAHVITRVSMYAADWPVATAVCALLPDDLANLPILGCATEVQVHHFDATECCIQANMLDEGPQLELEFRASESSQRHIRNYPNGELLYAVVRDDLDILNDCPARLFHVDGNLRCFTWETWIAPLDRFPDLEQLEIQDLQVDSYDALDHLLQALTVPSGTRPGAVCPRLQRFRFEGAIHKPKTLKRVRECFMRRQKRFGLPPLCQLEFNLYPDDEWSADDIMELERGFVVLAVTVVLKVHQPGDRDY